MNYSNLVFGRVFKVFTILPHRTVAGKKSLILHQEVIDKYKQNVQPLPSPNSLNQDDMPIPDLENPYKKAAEKCILCKHDIDLDYKNVRLLSQFVSSHSGRIYGRGTTGLCLYMQKRVAKLIKRSRYFGYMAYEMKDPRYINDPKLFDPFQTK